MEKKIERMMYIERQSQTDNRSAQRGFLPHQTHAKNYGGGNGNLLFCITSC